MNDSVLRLAQFVHLLLLALVLGVFWGTWFSLSRSIGSLSAETFLEVGHSMIANLGGPMAVLMPATLLSALPVLIGFRRQHRRTGFRLMLAGLGLLVVVLVITLAVNVPIDGDIARWTVGTLPGDWTITRDRWELFHTSRTFVCLAAFACALAAILSAREAGPTT